MAVDDQHYVYIIQCSDGTFYTGYTNNLEKRLKQHDEGKGAKYTRGRTPVTLRYSKVFSTRTEAMQTEYKIKQLPREKKLDLIRKQGDVYVGTEKL